MSDIGIKIKQVFGAAAVYKSPALYDVFNGRNLPSFVKDFLISQHMSNDGTFNRDKLISFLDKHIPKDNSSILSRLRQGEVLTLLTRFVITTNLAQNKTCFQIPDMGLKASDTLIADHLIAEFPDDLVDGEKWGIIKLYYAPPTDTKRGYVEMVNFKPFRPMQKLDIDFVRKCRAQFSLQQWIDVLLSAMEYTPSCFENQTQKLEFLTRLLPFIEPRLNLIELAPKGTGKSYVFGNLSKFVWLVSGGKVSRAKLVYDKSIQKPGIMRFYDLVVFDEIQTITFADNSEMQSFLKNYLESGRATIDNYEFMSECGLMLLGNIPLSSLNEPLSDMYFETLPELFKESALLDRFHSMIEGWLLPRINVGMFLDDWTLNVEFFSEVLHQMRTETIYSHIVNDLIDVPKDAEARHTKAVKKIATAYLKLLFPHITKVEDVNKEEFYTYCLMPAIARRNIIRQQCSYIDTEAAFSKPMPEYKIK